MPFPTDPVHSAGWFDNCFENAQAVPTDLRAASQALCTCFNIRGICDPMYLANLVAMELGRGDGRGEFHRADVDVREEFSSRIDKTVERIAFAYSTCVGGNREDIARILREHLNANA